MRGDVIVTKVRSMPLRITAAAAFHVVLLSISASSFASTYFGVGNTTLTCSDWDRDGYGTGPGCAGPDADDDDATVNTVASWKAKYGTIDALLAKRGYLGILRYWFIDYANGNDATCHSGTSTVAQAKPCATWVKVKASTVKAGDVVVFRGGATPPSTVIGLNYPTIKGTKDHPVLFISYPGELFVVDRSPKSDGTEVGTGIAGGYNEYLTFDGLKVRSSGRYGNGIVLNFPHNVTVRNMETERNYSCLRMMQDQQDVLIERNVFHGNTGTECVYLGSRDMPSRNVVMRNNVINVSSGLGSGFPAVQYNGRVTNLVEEGNIVFGAEQCFSWLEGVSNSAFRNNLCFGGDKAMLTIYNYPGYQTPDCKCTGICPYDQTGNVIESNTLVRPRFNREGKTYSIVSAFIVNNVSYCRRGDLGHNTWRNNIVYGYGGFPLMWYANSDGTADAYIRTSKFQNNLWFKTGSTTPNKIFGVGNMHYSGNNGYTPDEFRALGADVSGDIVADPLFEAYDEANWSAPEKNDFRLQPNSPAIGAGIATGIVSDIRGLRQTTHPTIGAYACSDPCRIK